MKYSAVERVEAIVSENTYVTSEVRKRKQFLKPLLKKIGIMDLIIIAVSMGFLVSLGFMIAGIVKALAVTEPLVSSISALM